MSAFTPPSGPPMSPREGAAVVALFDGHCGVCSASAAWFAARDPQGRVERLDLRHPDAAARFPDLDPDAVRALMHVVDASGRVIIGLDAVIAVLSEMGRWSLLAALLRLPGVHLVAELGYRAFARNRLWFNRFVAPPSPDEPVCDGDACAIDWEALARSEAAHGERSA